MGSEQKGETIDWDKNLQWSENHAFSARIVEAFAAFTMWINSIDPIHYRPKKIVETFILYLSVIQCQEQGSNKQKNWTSPQILELSIKCDDKFEAEMNVTHCCCCDSIPYTGSCVYIWNIQQPLRNKSHCNPKSIVLAPSLSIFSLHSLYVCLFFRGWLHFNPISTCNLELIKTPKSKEIDTYLRRRIPRLSF